MAQDYGVAQPIADFFGYGKKATPKKEEAKPDTSWHDSMVKQASDSFRKLSDRNLGGKKTATVKKRKRAIRRKR